MKHPSLKNILPPFHPRPLALALSLVLAIVCSPSSARAADELSAGDKAFFKKAAEGGMAEVELGKLAEKKGMANETKEMGRRMVTDHSKANEELEKLAMSKGVTLPKELAAAHKSTMSSLDKMEGEKFDHAYHTDLIKNHREDIALFEKAAGSKDADIKAFAGKTLPTLKEHLGMLEKQHDMSKKSGEHKHDKSADEMKSDKTSGKNP